MSADDVYQLHFETNACRQSDGSNIHSCPQSLFRHELHCITAEILISVIILNPPKKDIYSSRRRRVSSRNVEFYYHTS